MQLEGVTLFIHTQSRAWIAAKSAGCGMKVLTCWSVTSACLGITCGVYNQRWSLCLKVTTLYVYRQVVNGVSTDSWVVG